MNGRWAQAAALAGVVAVAALVWGTLGQRLEVPTVFGDELDLLGCIPLACRPVTVSRCREGDYAFGPVLPVIYAPVHAIADDDVQAYAWVRALNALLFALAVGPDLPARPSFAPARLVARLRGARGMRRRRRSTPGS